jgi:uncharacterized membrane protein (UPF0127 family)
MLSKFWPAAGTLFIAVAVVGLLLVIGAPTSADGLAMGLPTDAEPLIVETASGERSFTIEIADSASERERGLMYRQQMADDHGMLFVFNSQQQVGFWMKNTVMPLDLLFISEDGTLKAVLRGEPYSEAVISPGVPVRFVLELKAGAAAANHIAAGDKVRHRVIGEAAK